MVFIVTEGPQSMSCDAQCCMPLDAYHTLRRGAAAAAAAGHQRHAVFVVTSRCTVPRHVMVHFSVQACVVLYQGRAVLHNMTRSTAPIPKYH